MRPLLAILSVLILPSMLSAAEPEDINQVQSTHEKIVAAEPNNVESLFILGLVYEKKGQKQDALKVWKQYLTAETDSAKKAIAQKHIHLLSQ